MGAVPILVVATARPELLERRAGWGGGKRNATTISLSPLSDEDTSRLIAALLDRPVLPAETQATLLHRAGGNPLYAEEYVRMLGERGADGGLPETVQGIVAARLDALRPEEKALVQDASVLGKVFWLGGVAAMNGAGRWELEERLHGLERKEFVRRERRSSVAGDSEYAFLHVLVRDVAYGQIPRAARADKHRRAAEWIESLGRPEDTAEMLAHHYLNALDYARASGQAIDEVGERARVALREAGDRAAALTAFSAAARFYERAIELWPSEDPERPQLLLAHARAMFNVDVSFAVDVVERAHAEILAAGERETGAELAAMLSVGEWNRGNRERSFSLMREAVELLEDAAPSRPKAMVTEEMGRLLILGGEGAAGADLVARAGEMAAELGLLDLQSRALNTLAIEKVTTGDLSGLQDLETSRALALEANALQDVIRAYMNLAALTDFVGDLRRCSELLEEGIEFAERFGIAHAVRWQRAQRVDIHYYVGRWDDAVGEANAFLAAVEAGTPHYLEGGVRMIRAAVAVARGDVARALEDEARALEHARELEDPQALHQQLCYSAWIRVDAGRAHEADALATEVLSFADADLPGTALRWPELAFALAALGRGEEFVALAERETRRSRWLDAAHQFARGRHEAAAETFADMGARTQVAYARLRGAERLVEEGRRSEADAQLEQALTFYRSVGATPYVREGETLLSKSA